MEQKARYFSPDVSFIANASANHNYATLRGLSLDMQGGLSVDYTFFDGGSFTANYRKAVHDEQAARADYKLSFRNTRELVKTEWNDLVVSKKRIVALGNHVKASRKTLGLFREEFKLGKRSLLNVLDSQNELFNSMASLVDAEFQVHSDTFALL